MAASLHRRDALALGALGLGGLAAVLLLRPRPVEATVYIFAIPTGVPEPGQPARAAAPAPLFPAFRPPATAPAVTPGSRCSIHPR